MSADVRDGTAAVRTAMLALLEESARTGYELHTQFERIVGEAWTLNSGQIYATLARLERDGLVAGRDDPPRGTGRPQRRYRLLPAGAQALRAWRQHPEHAPTPVRDVLFLRLLFTPPEDLPALRTLLALELARAEHLLAELPHAQDVAPWTVRRRHLVAAGTRLQIEARLAWLRLALDAVGEAVGGERQERKAVRS